MARTLLVTNDFPPTVGGIQSYLRDFVSTLAPDDVVVLASTQNAEDAAQFHHSVDYRVYRDRAKVLLPTPRVAATMSRIIREENIDTVWFGAAAPLGLLAPVARRAGAQRVIATTHGHEVGWSMLPIARQILRFIGTHSDVVTYISDYTLRRIRPAFGECPDYVSLPSAVDTSVFSPASAEERQTTRTRWGLGAGPVVVCISRLVARKGQDQLVRAWPTIRSAYPTAQLVIVGDGPYRDVIEMLRTKLKNEDQARVHLTGKVEFAEMTALLAASDVFAMPARTRGKGLDVEGLGIVYLEAQAAGVAVLAGNSGGAPETVTPATGVVVDGRSLRSIETALITLLSDEPRRQQMGRAGRRHVQQDWTWEVMGNKLRSLVDGELAAKTTTGTAK